MRIIKGREAEALFGKASASRGLSPESKAVKELKPGEAWIQEHKCEANSINDCTLGRRLMSLTQRNFTAKSFSTTHTNGIIGFYRRPTDEGNS